MAELSAASIAGFFGSSIATIIFWTILLVIVLAIFGVFTWWIYNVLVYRFKINIFENLSGAGYIPTKKDKARIVRFGKSGETMFWLKKAKDYLPSNGQRIGKNNLAYCIGPDGIWYNITFGDLDTKMGILDIEPVDRDMRHHHVAKAQMIEQDYNKKSWMDKYGVIVFGALILGIFAIFAYAMFDRMADAATVTQEGLKVGQELSKANLQIVERLDQLLSGSGIVPAPGGGG